MWWLVLWIQMHTPLFIEVGPMGTLEECQVLMEKFKRLNHEGLISCIHREVKKDGR